MRTQTRDQLDMLLAEYEATRQRLDGLAAQVAAVTGEGRSADRSVTAVVGPHGQLLDLRLDATLAQRLDPSTLEARVLEAVGVAGERARAAATALLREAMPGPLGAMLNDDGTLDLGQLLPPDLDSLRRVGAR